MTTLAPPTPYPMRRSRIARQLEASGLGPENRCRNALRRGSPERALEILMEAYGDDLYRYCRHLVRDPDLASDVHQTAFVQAYQAFGTFRGGSTFKTWLFGIARHRALDAIKVRRRRDLRFVAADESTAEVEDTARDAEDRLLAESRKQALEDCVQHLAPRVRDALLLRFQQEMSYVTMAQVVKERAATLQARVARALPILRRCLEDRGVEE
ncbi:MAG: RNA polymerase sigma factor [Acidobacteriota bacterium]